MRIFIDGYEANSPERLGSSQVGFELLRHLEKIDKAIDYTIVLPSSPQSDLPKQRPNWQYRLISPRRFWTRLALPKVLSREKALPDVFFSPTHYIPHFNKVKKVNLIFDLSFLEFKDMFKKRDLWQLGTGTKYAAINSKQIITISESSKKQIVKAYGLKEDKITVAYPGYDRDLFYPRNDRKQIVGVLEKYKIAGDYLIYIGTIQPRKNLVRLMEALVDIPNLKLVVIGKTTGQGRQGWMFEDILKKPKQLGIEKQVIFTGFVPTIDLPFLLTGAKAYVLPSLWEGFGIPVLEAMACGVPVIVSNVSSLPEVVGDAGVLIDPYSVKEIRQAIIKVTSDRRFNLELSKKGIAQAHKFSWEKMAKQVLEVLESVAEQN